MLNLRSTCSSLTPASIASACSAGSARFVARHPQRVRIVILTVGRAKPPFADDCEHYLRLLRGRLRVELVEARDERRARERLPADAHVVLLSEHGRAHTSPGFARWLEQRLLAARDLWFVVGGPQGIELAEADETLSLGPLTLPHQLARVVLLEQLFRAHKILAGEPYHY